MELYRRARDRTCEIRYVLFRLPLRTPLWTQTRAVCYVTRVCLRIYRLYVFIFLVILDLVEYTLFANNSVLYITNDMASWTSEH